MDKSIEIERDLNGNYGLVGYELRICGICREHREVEGSVLYNTHWISTVYTKAWKIENVDEKMVSPSHIPFSMRLTKKIGQEMLWKCWHLTELGLIFILEEFADFILFYFIFLAIKKNCNIIVSRKKKKKKISLETPIGEWLSKWTEEKQKRLKALGKNDGQNTELLLTRLKYYHLFL